MKCSSCKIEKPFEFFGKNKASKTGYFHRCKDCVKQHNKQQYLKHKEKRLVSAQEYYNSNKDAVKNAQQSYRLRNQQSLSVRQKEWRTMNKARVKMAMLSWNENNKDKKIYHTAKYRASVEKAVPSWFEEEKVALVYKKAQEMGFQVDHIVPLNSPFVCGLHCWANLQLLEQSLNASKRNLHWPDMPG